MQPFICHSWHVWTCWHWTIDKSKFNSAIATFKLVFHTVTNKSMHHKQRSKYSILIVSLYQEPQNQMSWSSNYLGDIIDLT